MQGLLVGLDGQGTPDVSLEELEAARSRSKGGLDVLAVTAAQIQNFFALASFADPPFEDEIYSYYGD